MAILDINKNSLPEQVQENKENISAIQTAMDDKASIDYVDEKDADTLQDAKDYADEKDADTLQDAKDYADEKVPKSIFTQRAGIIAGYAAGDPREIPAPDDSAGAFLRLIGTNDNKGIIWVKGVKKSDVDSESATAGYVLGADGNGGANWIPQSGQAAETLLWSGSLNITDGNSETLTNVAFNKGDKLKIIYRQEGNANTGTIVYCENNRHTEYDSVCSEMIIANETYRDRVRFIRVSKNNDDLIIFNLKAYNVTDWSVAAHAIQILYIYKVN